MNRALVVMMAASACGGASLPCVPTGEHDFFMVRATGCAALEGTFAVQAGGKGTLLLSDGFDGACALSSVSDDRHAPIAACQLSWDCRPSGCAGCGGWQLFALHAPTGDGLIAGGRALQGQRACDIGRWSAMRRAP